MTLNFFTNIISTTFSLKLKTEKNVKEIAEFIIQIRGYKKEKELETDGYRGFYMGNACGCFGAAV